MSQSTDVLGSNGPRELAALVHDREVSPTELVEAAIARIERVNPKINAFIETNFELALQTARDVSHDLPFAGVPIAIKGNVPCKGFLNNSASLFIADRSSEYDSNSVRRIRDAGFIILGLTNLPEFAILPTCEPRFYGPTNNPWKLDLTPGGSSGGSAAAVAAGLVPLAHGNDGGGSIRIPAACCGLVGLKATRNRISRAPDLGDSFLATDGALTKTVADAAAMLDLLSGYELGDANTTAPLPDGWLERLGQSGRRLKVAVSTDNPYNSECEPENLKTMRETAHLLEKLGHQVVEHKMPMPGDEAVDWFLDTYAATVSLGVASAVGNRGRLPEDDEIEPLTKALVQKALEINSTLQGLNLVRLQKAGRTYIEAMADFDVLLTPALGQRPLPTGEMTGYGEGDQWETLVRSADFTPYTGIANISGQPAISVPMQIGADGLPTSIQLIGHHQTEPLLLELAMELENAREQREFVAPLNAYKL